MHSLAEKYIRKSALPTIFCPGCGHGTVLNAFLRAIDSLDVMDKLAMTSGIGCSSWLPVFIKADVMHTLHGRAIPVATGIKMSRPDLKVVVFTGDGDGIGIGGNHLLHAARRNIDITVIMLDNSIYGMTGGQVAPTTSMSAKTQTSPYGNPENPIQSSEVVMAAGATYVARWTVAQPKALKKAICEAINHKGFSFLHVYSQCPTQAGRYIHGTGDPKVVFNMLKDNSIRMKKAEGLDSRKLKDKIVIGKLLEINDRPEFTESITAVAEKAQN